MIFTGENDEEVKREYTFSSDNGSYQPKTKLPQRTEKDKIMSAGSGCGAAIICYIAVNTVLGDIFSALLYEIYKYGAFELYEFLCQISNMLSYVLSLALSFGVMLALTKCPVKVALPFRKAKADMLICGVLIGLGFTVLSTYIFSYFDSALYMLGIEIVMPDTGRPESLPAYILYGVSTVLFPAFIEEMAFRGVVMQSLRRFGDGFALLMSSFLFGLCHMNLYQIPYAMFMGLCIGYFVMRSGSLWVGVIIHFFNNGMAFLLEYFLDVFKANEVQVSIVSGTYRAVCLVLGLFSVLFLSLRYKDMFELAPAKTALTEGKKMLYFVLSPVMLFVIGAAVYFSSQYINILW